MLAGFIERATPSSVSGWAAGDEGGAAYVIAEFQSQILGVSRADIPREDLNGGPEPRGAFHIAFSRDIPTSDLGAVTVRRLSAVAAAPLVTATPLAATFIEPRNAVQAFILGSPRSGTSELAATLSSQLGLPWVGEGHLAPTLAAAEAMVAGDANSPSGLVRALAEEAVGAVVLAATRRVYHRAHGSGSFLDKTPGQEMIRAAPFLQRSFPEARFIFMRRNGVANVVSRMKKFGGDFGEHCQDWAASMEAWEAVRPELTYWLEIEQETMLAEPLTVAAALADFFGRPDSAHAIARSLIEGASERTGAGLGKRVVADAEWSPAEVSQFRTYCGDMMHRWGYRLD